MITVIGFGAAATAFLLAIVTIALSKRIAAHQRWVDAHERQHHRADCDTYRRDLRDSATLGNPSREWLDLQRRRLRLTDGQLGTDYAADLPFAEEPRP